MERLVVPTAPGERAKWKSAEPKRIGWLLLTLLLSLGTGFSGALLARVYQLDLLAPNTPDIIVVPDNASSGSATLVHSLQDQQASAVVLVQVNGVTATTGVVLSSDGWIVALAEPLTGATEVKIETHNGKVHPSDQIVVDDVTGLAYIHVPQSGLRVAQFRNEVVALGQSLIAYGRTDDGDQVAFASVSAVSATAVRIDRTLAPVLLGAPLYDLDYAIVGFATSTDAVIPIAVVNEVAYGLFTTGEIVRDRQDL